MRLKVKDMDIATGGPLIVVLNAQDARRLDLHSEDRIRIRKGRKEIIAAVDIAESTKAVPYGRVGLFEEVLDSLDTKHNDNVFIFPEKKPESLTYVKKKLDGMELRSAEIKKIIMDLMENNITDIELTYFISACYTNGLSLSETAALTKAMIESGETLKWNRRPIMDLHCIGGVPGNRTTMIVVPIIAAAGLTIPKISSRSITSAAGTADTMEVLCNVALSLEKIKQTVNKTNGCIAWGGAVHLAPADDKIIKVENPLSIDAEGNMISSIMAKKASVGSTHLLIDIPIGREAKIKTRAGGIHLKNEFEKLGSKLGIRVNVFFTDGTQPVGNGIGPALEARDALWILKNDTRGPTDLRERSIRLAEELLSMAGKEKGMAREILESGLAYRKMLQIINAQGKRIKDFNRIMPGKFRYDFVSKNEKRISHIDNKLIAKTARLAGAPQDKGAGIYLYAHKGQKIKKGEPFFTLFAESRQKLEFAIQFLENNKKIMY